MTPSSHSASRPRHVRLAVALSSLMAVGALVAPTGQARLSDDGLAETPVTAWAPATSGPRASTQPSVANPVGADGCFDQVASGVAVHEMHLYQSVRVTLIAGGRPVVSTERAVDVVAGKSALIGINLETERDWATREVAVRVTAVGASGELTTHSTRIVPGEDSGSHPTGVGDVVLDLPSTAVTPEARLSVSIVECTAATGTDAQDSAPPVQIEVDLAARRTGGIKVHLVPFRVAGFVPSTSPDVVNGYREALLAMYPVTDVDITIGPLVDVGDQRDLGALLVALGEIRDEDRPDRDVYYYGMVTGAPTRETYCDDCITGTSEDGGGSRPGFAIGAAFGDPRSEDTFLHELGHAHGLLHAPCGDVDLLNVDFPYPDGTIGVPGYDRRTGELVPPSTHDFMGYCFPRWISDHHYQQLVDRVAAVNGHGADPSIDPAMPDTRMTLTVAHARTSTSALRSPRGGMGPSVQRPC